MRMRSTDAAVGVSTGEDGALLCGSSGIERDGERRLRVARQARRRRAARTAWRASRRRARRSRRGPAARSARRLRRGRAPSAPCRRSSRSWSSGSAAGGSRAPSTAASLRVARRAMRARSAKVTSRIAFATATPTAMIAPMKDWMFSVVPVSQSVSTTPASTAGTVETTASARRNDWKFAASSRKITTTATSRPERKPSSSSLQRHDLAAHVDVRLRRRRADFGERLASICARDAAEVGAVDVRGDADDARHVVALVLADGGARRDARDVAQQHGFAAGRLTGTLLQVLERRSSAPAESAPAAGS